MFFIDTDYSNELNPSGACILDYLRCSISFKTAKELLETVQLVIDKIENNTVDSISKILRIKNGFENTLNFDGKNLSSYNYVDLKMNVIFNNENKTECQIVEIQFLLDFLLKAKKLGHKYYGIKRKNVEINSVSNIMYSTNNNYSKYKNKILEMINDYDINQLGTHLLLRPNCILSMIYYNNSGYRKNCSFPYLYIIGQTNSLKMFELFLDCIFHYGEILLNEKQPLNYNVGFYDDFNNKDKIDNSLLKHNLFIQKYFNFSLGDYPLIDEFGFVK